MLDKSTYRPRLKNAGPNKISTIKCIREHTRVGLKEAKDIADLSAPFPEMSQAAANLLRIDLQKIGADFSNPSFKSMKPSFLGLHTAPPSRIMIESSQLRQAGNMFEITIQHTGLQTFKVVKGRSPDEARLKAQAILATWERSWERQSHVTRLRLERLSKALTEQQCKEVALERTKEAESQLSDLANILRQSGQGTIPSIWDELRDRSPFPTPLPERKHGKLEAPITPSETQFKAHLGILDRLIKSRSDQKEEQSRRDYSAAMEVWQTECRAVEEVNHKNEIAYQTRLEEWKAAKLSHELERAEKDERIEEQKALYAAGDASAVEFYNLQVISRVEYLPSFPKEVNLQYNHHTQTLALDYELPNSSALPSIKEVKYVVKRGEYQDVAISDAWLKREYDDVLYRICLRTIHELYNFDEGQHLASVIFNGWVTSIDKSTGREAHACVISLHTTKDEFLAINLSNVDPKTCFKKMKGVSASKLIELTPIRPIASLNMEDERFVSPYKVVEGVDERTNLASMDWLDFENLIREIFEKEFSQNGGAVKITQASRDGGVDAIAFDPDPIRGGKIVIQAKRYTNTVGVAAVRDLFGTVHNEGATKGILVTTSDFGPDAHAFAKDKPLTLLNGSELLYLLGRHGHTAKIDIREAKLLYEPKR